MDTLIVVRHGDYDEGAGATAPLNERGRLQMADLAGKLAKFLAGRSHKILYSPVRRVVESADILHDTIGGVCEENEIFRSSGAIDPRTQQAMQIIDSQDVDVVIVVTHHEYSAALPWEYGGRFGKRYGAGCFPDFASGKGEARVIDMNMKTCTSIT